MFQEWVKWQQEISEWTRINFFEPISGMSINETEMFHIKKWNPYNDWEPILFIKGASPEDACKIIDTKDRRW